MAEASLSLASSLSSSSLRKPYVSTQRPYCGFNCTRTQRLNCNASSSSSSSSSSDKNDGYMGLDVLKEFIQLNIGTWTGSFKQCDAHGNVMQHIPTRLTAHSYGRGDQVSLYQTLSIKQAPPKTLISGETYKEDEWAEFKLDETNILTIDSQQQVGYFPRNRAYTVSHRTAEMLDKIIRAGVLGEDGDDLEEDEIPPGIKLPSRRPALVCESCLYADDGKSRVRAFHVLDPRGLLDFIGVFEENKDDVTPTNKDNDQKKEDRIGMLLGSWAGRAVTRRTGIYGSTLFEEDTLVSFQLADNGSIVQNIQRKNGNLNLTGTAYGSMLKFDKGLQMTLLPGGLAMAAPVNVGQSVGRSQSFYFEFSWVYAPGKRRRLVRTYDTQGLVVSSTFFDEVKV